LKWNLPLVPFFSTNFPLMMTPVQAADTTSS